MSIISNNTNYCKEKEDDKDGNKKNEYDNYLRDNEIDFDFEFNFDDDIENLSKEINQYRCYFVPTRTVDTNNLDPSAQPSSPHFPTSPLLSTTSENFDFFQSPLSPLGTYYTILYCALLY